MDELNPNIPLAAQVGQLNLGQAYGQGQQIQQQAIQNQMLQQELQARGLLANALTSNLDQYGNLNYGGLMGDLAQSGNGYGVELGSQMANQNVAHQAEQQNNLLNFSTAINAALIPGAFNRSPQETHALINQLGNAFQVPQSITDSIHAEISDDPAQHAQNMQEIYGRYNPDLTLPSVGTVQTPTGEVATTTNRVTGQVTPQGNLSYSGVNPADLAKPITVTLPNGQQQTTTMFQLLKDQGVNMDALTPQQPIGATTGGEVGGEAIPGQIAQTEPTAAPGSGVNGQPVGMTTAPSPATIAAQNASAMSANEYHQQAQKLPATITAGRNILAQLAQGQITGTVPQMWNKIVSTVGPAFGMTQVPGTAGMADIEKNIANLAATLGAPTDARFEAAIKGVPSASMPANAIGALTSQVLGMADYTKGLDDMFQQAVSAGQASPQDFNAFQSIYSRTVSPQAFQLYEMYKNGYKTMAQQTLKALPPALGKPVIQQMQFIHQQGL